MEVDRFLAVLKRWVGATQEVVELHRTSQSWEICAKLAFRCSCLCLTAQYSNYHFNQFFVLTCTNFICFVARLKSCFQNVVCLFNAFSSACLYVLIFVFLFWHLFYFTSPSGIPQYWPCDLWPFNLHPYNDFLPSCDLFWGLVLLHLVV